MIKKIIVPIFVSIVSLIIHANAQAAQNLKLNMANNPVFSIGDKDVLFGSINWICEDNQDNIYVLDSKLYKIYKISPKGELLASWGNRGQGPLDWLQAHSLFYLPDGTLGLNDNMNYINIFTTDGKFVKRIFVPGNCLNLCMLSENLFYGWQWTKEGKEQVLVDKDGKTKMTFYSISRTTFSVNVPDETGRMVMSSHFSQWYSPQLLFTRCGNYAALAMSNKYEITLLNTDGKIITRLSRNITGDEITGNEREQFKTEIMDNKNFSPMIAKKLIAIMPKNKNFFSSIILSKKYLWVCRLRKNATAENSPYDVDLFDFKGTFKGSFQLLESLYHVGDKYLYFVKTDHDDNLLVSKNEYTLE